MATFQPKLIAIEGPVGVGKTTLCELLAPRFGGRCVLENAETNPFLGRSHDRPELALPAQIFFVLSRYAQQLDLAQADLFAGPVFCDYLFARERIFAAIHLSEDDRRIHDQLFRLLAPRLSRPDLVVFLTASPEVLAARARRSARTGERDHPLSYFQEVTRVYNEFFFRYTETPLLVIHTSEINFVEREQDLASIEEIIRRARRGVHHYNPLGSR